MKDNTLAGESDTDPPVEKKPSFFSWRWWVLFFGAFKVWKYSPRDWAIWNLSSYATYGMVFGVFKPVAGFIAAKLPWLLPGLKAVWAKMIAGLIVLFHAISP